MTSSCRNQLTTRFQLVKIWVANASDTSPVVRAPGWIVHVRSHNATSQELSGSRDGDYHFHALAQRILPAEEQPNLARVPGDVRVHANDDAGMIADDLSSFFI